MTIFYMDPENGNDTADGLSFANRWKTLSNGATAARIAPGDVIRVIASPYPVSLGDGTWTDGNTEVVLASPKNVVIDECDSGWVGNTNVTLSHTTSTTILRTGVASLQLSIATAFTTGRIAHKPLPATLDLSAYSKISFWFQSTTSTTTQLELRLCSDTDGLVTLLAIPFTLGATADTSYTTSQWTSFLVDSGGALPAGVNSIALYAITDPGSTTYRLDNIVAVKSGADELHHGMMFGKNTVGEPEWYGIQQITPTGLVFGGAYNQTAADPGRPYSGVTETVTTYARKPMHGWSSADRSLTETGTASAPFTLSGGWNRTDMSTQDGETWLFGKNFLSRPIASSSTYSFWRFEKFGLFEYVTAFSDISSAWDIDIVGAVSCNKLIGAQAAVFSANANKAKVKIGYSTGLGEWVFDTISRQIDLEIGRVTGSIETSTSNALFNSPTMPSNSHPIIWKVGRVDNNSGAAFTGYESDIRIHGCLSENNAADVIITTDISSRTAQFVNCTLASATKINSTSAKYVYKVQETNIEGDARKHLTTVAGCTFGTQEAVVHTPGGVAWELKPTSTAYINEFEPASFPIAHIACGANKLVTVKCWMRRTDIGLTIGLYVDDTWPGVAETTATISASADVWEEVTLTFTPTVAGVIPIYAIGYGGTTYSGYFADMTITQAD